MYHKVNRSFDGSRIYLVGAIVWFAGAADPANLSRQWAKSEHLARMQQKGHFRYVNEVVLHQIKH